MNNPQTLAHTLNRIGNWHLNVDQPQQALAYHGEALALFREANDQNGVAETLDLLGLTHEMVGDLQQAYAEFSEGVGYLRELGNQARLVSSLAELSSLGENYLGSTLVPAPLTQADMIQLGEQALTLARQIGLRSGEAYVLTMLGLYRGYYGDYERALEYARESLRLTQEIEHVQWNCFSHNLLGWLYLDLLALDDARQECELALSLAQKMGSSIFLQCTSQALASTYIAQQNLKGAETVLSAVLGADPFDNITYTKRLDIAAWGELALAKGEPGHALEIADRLVHSAKNTTPATVIPRLWLLRGSALTQLKRFDEGEALLTAARSTAQARGIQPMLWRIHLALGKLYQLQDRRKAAEAEYYAARHIVQALAERVPDSALRTTFLKGTEALLPHPRALTTRRADKARFGGLTTREREITALIALGKSNREIADKLVLSERTVAAHVASILNKLTFTSRTQIAVWAVEHGLAGKN
jgi:DNA-binding CsgD family transcriptional regulator